MARPAHDCIPEILVTARRDDIRPGEIATDARVPADATLGFIGRIETPWSDRMACPRQGRIDDGPLCRIQVFAPWRPALAGIEKFKRLEIFYWLHKSRRDLLVQTPRTHGKARGAFALRSPVRPNPIGTSIVRLVGVEADALVVRGLDCLNGTPLIDIKPDRALFVPLAPPTPGDFDVAPVEDKA